MLRHCRIAVIKSTVESSGDSFRNAQEHDTSAPSLHPPPPSEGEKEQEAVPLKLNSTFSSLAFRSPGSLRLAPIITAGKERLQMCRSGGSWEGGGGDGWLLRRHVCRSCRRGTKQPAATDESRRGEEEGRESSQRKTKALHVLLKMLMHHSSLSLHKSSRDVINYCKPDSRRYNHSIDLMNPWLVSKCSQILNPYKY